MCMKYVNAVVACYKTVTIENDEIVSFNAPFNSIKSKDKDAQLFIDDFVVVTQIDFLGTINQEHALDNPLEQKQCLDFIIRLTKCERDDEKRIGFDLDSFSIDFAEMYAKEQVDRACFDFLNYTRITNVDKLDLPGGAGKYVIKVLIKKADEDEYSIQSMTRFVVY